MKSKDAQLMALVTKLMGDADSRAEALESVATLSAEDMRQLVALLAGDRNSDEASTRDIRPQRAAS